jgi:hypothetical protein
MSRDAGGPYVFGEAEALAAKDRRLNDQQYLNILNCCDVDGNPLKRGQKNNSDWIYGRVESSSGSLNFDYTDLYRLFGLEGKERVIEYERATLHRAFLQVAMESAEARLGAGGKRRVHGLPTSVGCPTCSMTMGLQASTGTS